MPMPKKFMLKAAIHILTAFLFCKIDDDGGNNLFSFSPGPFPKLILFKYFVKNLKVHARGAAKSILDVYQWNFGGKSNFFMLLLQIILNSINCAISIHKCQNMY